MTKEHIGPLYKYGPISSGKTSIMRRLYETLREDRPYHVLLVFAPNAKTPNAFPSLIMDAW